MIEHIISLIAPHKCVACNLEGSLLCDPCSKVIGANTERCRKCKSILNTCGCACYEPAVHVRAVTSYTSLPQQLVWKLKFERARAAAPVIAKLCTPLVSEETTVISYVPTANSRVRMRGYDQAQLIARKVAQYKAVPMVPLLARTSNVRQVGANASVRRTQLEHAFRPTALSTIQGAHVTLIDDVLTTGSTIEAAAKTLLEAGATRVEAVVFVVA